MPLTNLGLPRGAGAALTADHASFAATLAAGRTIATLSNPFAGATGYAIVGTAPAQLALSGGAIVAGAAAAVGGARYAIKIRATSADGAREVAETLSFLATGATVQPSFASASVRARLPNAQAVTAANQFVQTFRVRDISNVDVADPWIEIWNGWIYPGVTPPGSPEQAGANPVPYRAAFVTGITGTAKAQTGATVTPLTWTAAYAGTAGAVWKLDGTTPSAADISAAVSAGTLALADTGRQLTLPGGWRARSDPATGLQIARRTPYFYQIEDAAPVGQYRISGGGQGRADLGDLQRAGSVSGQYVYNSDFSAGQTPSNPVTVPVLVGGTSSAATKTVAVTGDSISMEIRDSAYGGAAIVGDGDQATAYALRALNAAGYAFVQTAVSSDKALAAWKSVTAGNGGMAQRLLSLRFASAILDGMGHNDRVLPFAGAAGAGWLATYRWWWQQLRGGALPGARLVKADLLPLVATGNTTDNFATTAGQTASTGPGSPQYDGINPWIARTGSSAGAAFDPAQGDPDASLSINAALYAWAAAQGLDVDAQHAKWPANGQSNQPLTAGNAVTYDGTHPKGPAHAGIAALIVPQLAAALGF